MQRRILQQLRRTPFDPRVRRLAELCAKFFNQPGLADAGLADDEHELPFARAGPFPAAGQDAKVLLAADERRENPGAFPAASAAHAHDAIERHRSRDALQLMRALVLNDEQPGDLPLDGRGDQNCSRLRGRLNSRGNVGRFPEHFAGGVDDDRAALKADASGKFGSAGCRVSRVEVGKRALDGERSPDSAFGVVFLRLRIAKEGHQPVAEPFQHVTAEADHRLRSLVEIGVDEIAPVFGVENSGKLVEPTRSQNITVMGRRSAKSECANDCGALARAAGEGRAWAGSGSLPQSPVLPSAVVCGRPAGRRAFRGRRQ